MSAARSSSPARAESQYDFPVSAQNANRPIAHTSVAGVSAPPCVACSGAIQSGVPCMPAAADSAVTVSFATPKSSTFTSNAASGFRAFARKTFVGFTSPCVIPTSCKSGAEGFAELREEEQDIRERHRRPLGEAAGEIDPFEELHRDPRHLRLRIEPGADDEDDVVALDLRADARLALERRPSVFVGRDVRSDDLQRSLGPRRDVLDDVHRAVVADAEATHDLKVFGEQSPRQEVQRRHFGGDIISDRVRRRGGALVTRRLSRQCEVSMSSGDKSGKRPPNPLASTVPMSTRPLRPGEPPPTDPKGDKPAKRLDKTLPLDAKSGLEKTLPLPPAPTAVPSAPPRVVRPRSALAQSVFIHDIRRVIPGIDARCARTSAAS